MSSRAATLSNLVRNATRVSDFWNKQSEHARSINSHWTNNRIISSNIYRLISGQDKHWLHWLLQDYFADRESIGNVLSVCCGDGAHELEVMRSGKARFLHGFDISEGAIQTAVQRLRDAGYTDDQFKLEVQDANDLRLSGKFDLVLSAGAIHHVTNLEGMMAKIGEMLAPDGRFALVEFVGPNRFQWTDEQVEIINRLLGALDPCYLQDGVRVRFGRPPIKEMMRIDPSEAVRSRDIIGLVREHFDVEYERSWHGTILHQLFPLLNSDLSNQGRSDFDSILRLIAEFEDILIRGGVVPTDFVFMVCRPRPGGPRRALTAAKSWFPTPKWARRTNGRQA